MSTENKWFDYGGEASFWENVPLRTIKKAFFQKGNTIKTLAKLVLNSVTYDFAKTAKGGAVIVPPDYSVIELIAPDGHIDYNSLLRGTLGNAFTETIAVLKVNPIPAWDKFAVWLRDMVLPRDIELYASGVKLETLDRTVSTTIGFPDFSNVTDMATFLEAVKAAAQNANGNALSVYQVDDAAFGWKLKIISLPDEDGKTYTTSIGFLFRE